MNAEDICRHSLFYHLLTTKYNTKIYQNLLPQTYTFTVGRNGSKHKDAVLNYNFSKLTLVYTTVL